ncbi:hypothetical protein [Deinococcus peraridilitoris]|uniref:Uncharacterized protein n=1 Tax=Deinococcus peraridilitoris (strain DSM 19664 / LMG 22246 / CIP 109416 / KR-200) TaxID=937777 RepID=L0A2C8_DEIPD|nr:hypothetical protein [Deinococcus peraridilitoris]AFZ67145.1 hypothetical protein Deipe_1605 [Deinococcus peraridilitoris DSM 19664]
MKEQLRRVLEMVARERLSAEDAGALLAALSPRLDLGPRWAHLFALLGEDGFSPEELAVLLEIKAGLRRPVPVGDFESVMEDVPRLVRDAMQGAFGRPRGPGGPGRPGGPFREHGERRSGRPGSILRVNVEDVDGSELRANLPLSLGEHAAKLLPPRVLAALERSGISSEALSLMLSANPPVGELLSVEAADGSEISLHVE